MIHIATLRITKKSSHGDNRDNGKRHGIVGDKNHRRNGGNHICVGWENGFMPLGPVRLKSAILNQN